MTGEPSSASELAPAPPAGVAEPWDAALELAVDRRAERRLFTRELAVLAVIAGLIALRLIFVHAG